MFACHETTNYLRSLVCFLLFFFYFLLPYERIYAVVGESWLIKQPAQIDCTGEKTVIYKIGLGEKFMSVFTVIPLLFSSRERIFVVAGGQ
jgi:hypothetical protein